MTTPRLVFLLDTPNIWFGQALAGTPARVLALAEHAHSNGAEVTVVLCDRGAEYGTAGDWATPTLLVHPTDFYSAPSLARILSSIAVDFLLVCEAEALLMLGRDLANRLGARLVYDVHDNEATVAQSLGEPPDVVARHALTQRGALETADHVIVSTRSESDMVRAVGIPPAHQALLPNGADIRYRRCWGPDIDARTLVFVGNLYYAPNARAVAYLADELAPSLGKLGVQVRIVGRVPEELRQATNGVVHMGHVPSVHDALRGATLAMAPLNAGSGAKMKVLDYMAAGLPVLGTSEAVTGLPAEHPGVHVEDDLRAWPTVVDSLLREPETLRLLGAEGRACVDTELSWQRIAAQLVEHARTWLRQPGASHEKSAEPGRLGLPRWLAEHADQHALPDPQWTAPSRPCWLRMPTRTDSQWPPESTREYSQ